MDPVDMIGLLHSMGTAADVVEAIDDPAARARHGWDLVGWSYELVPGGVRLLLRDGQGQVTAAVAALVLPESLREQVAPAYKGSGWPTMILLLG